MTPLPDRLALAPHHGLLATGPGVRRIGAGARARVLGDLSPAAVAALDRLAAGSCHTADLLAGAPPGPDRAALAGLLGVLWRARLLTDPGTDDRVRRHRASALVEVRGDSVLAVAVVLGVARAGIGHVHPQVAGRAAAGDVVVGLPEPHVGRERADALHDLLGAAGVRTGPPGRVPPDLVVLAGAPVPGPDGAVDHLVVTLRNGRGAIGPLVLPGRGPCLDCLAAAGDGPVPGPRTAEPHAVAATAALAVGQVLAALDGPVRGGPPPASWAAVLELDPDAATIATRPVRVAPDCRCGTPTGPTAGCGPTAVGWTIEV